MKAIFDRHAERLSGAERQAIWRAIWGHPRAARRSRLRWALAAASAAVAIAVITFAVVLREPPAPSHPAPAASGAGSEEMDRALPKQPPVARRVEPGPRRHAPRSGAATSGNMALAIAESLARTATVHDVPDARAAQPENFGRPGRVDGTVTARGNTPIEYANVIILGTKLGTMTDANGNFVITGVPAGSQQVQVQPLGYDKQVQSVVVDPDATTTVAFNLGDSRVVKQIEEIAVGAGPKRIDSRSSASVQGMTARKPGKAQKGEQLLRGGRGGEVTYVNPGGQSLLVQPPVVPTTGGTRLPNDEPYDSMFFRNYGVNPFIATDEDSLSTFAVDVDAASFTVARRYIELGHLPPADAVRVEEFVNFFPQGYPKFENEDFKILVDGAPSRFGRGYQLVRIGIKGREVEKRDRMPAQLTFVIDVSGSMDRENRLDLVKQALRLLVDQLRDDDRVGIVVYGTTGRVLLEPVGLGQPAAAADGAHLSPEDRAEEENEPQERWTGRRTLLEAIDQLHAEGSTNAEEGLELGYEMARRCFREHAINRIVLCSDGVANTGVTGPESILARARTGADRGIHLSTIGFGMGNYNDVLMEQLADKGDGNYYYVDDLAEARRVFVEKLTGTLQTIAKDAKIQVEFRPSRVLRYRLLGFENRDVADRDFRNDKVDAGEIGAGHEVTALYEVKLAPHADRGPIATVRVRYARPEPAGGGAPVREIAAEIGATALSRRFEDASPYFRLDAAVAEFAEILRGSYWAKGSRLADVIPVARGAARDLRESAAAELVPLLEHAARLSSAPAPAENKDDP